MPNDLDFSLEHTVSGSQLLDGSNRLKRAAWLSKHIRDDDLYLLQDGVLSQILLAEVLETFIGGQFIATIILGFSLVERTIAGRLHYVGENKVVEMTSEDLLNAAVHKGWLTTDEHLHLNELRKLRNPIVHFRDHLAKSRPEVRAFLEAKTTTRMLEADAEKFLDAAISILKKTSL